MYIRPSNKTYQLKITLADSCPPIWRRLLVPGHITLLDLHDLIQVSMGWTNSHLHHFILKKNRFKPTPQMQRDYLAGKLPSTALRGVRVFSDPEFELEETEDESRVRFVDLPLVVRSKLVYEYDFGDSWEHVILVEKITEQDSPLEHPLCLAGELACPPEDCGGIYGYYETLDSVRDSAHPEHEERKEWLGDFDPDYFSLEQTNKRIRAMYHPKPRRKKKEKKQS